MTPYTLNMNKTIIRQMRKAISIFILVAFISTSLKAPAYAQDFRLPAPGVMIHLSPPLEPAILKGIKVHTDNPFRFDFILDRGDGQLSSDQIKEESSKLIKYFLASLTIPEEDLWVNLSPYEKDRIIPNSFGLTEMGRDLLAEDYMLKQITASLIYPEDETGKRFWKRIYEEATERFGTTNIPVNTFNKVWIVPDKAVVYENTQSGTAYIVKSTLKVMLEQDYLALEKNTKVIEPDTKSVNQLGSQVVREIVIPELTKEVNDGKNFTQLRQVYQSLILATWYKKKIKDSILEQVYVNKNKVAGVNIDDPQEKQKIYERYLQAFKKGVYNYIKEEIDPSTQETIPRKYFSGGLTMDGEAMDAAMSIVHDAPSVSNSDRALLVQAGIDPFKGNVPGEILAHKVHQDRAMIGEWQEGRENGLVYRFGWQKKLTPVEGEEQRQRIFALPANQSIDPRIFSPSEIFEVNFILSTGGIDALKNGEAIYDFYVRPGMRSTADVSSFYKGYVKLIFRAGKLDHWEGLDISPKRMKDFPWLEHHIQEELDGLKGHSFDQAMTVEEALSKIFGSDDIRQIVKNIQGNSNPKSLEKHLLELISFPGFGRWTNEGYWYEQLVIQDVMSTDDPIKQIERLMQPGVMENIGILANRMYRYRDGLGGDSRIEIFRDVVKSANVRSKAARAVKVIDTLVAINMYNNVRFRILRALNKANLSEDTDGVLNKIAEMRKSSKGDEDWQIISEQIAQALDKGDLNGAVDTRTLLSDSLQRLLTSKRLGAENAGKAKVWAERGNTSLEVLEQAVRVIGTSPYLKTKNTELLLAKLVNKTSVEAKRFLDGIEGLSNKMNGIYFHSSDELAKGQGIVENVLGRDDVETACQKIIELMSVSNFGRWTNDGYWYEQRLLLDVMETNEPLEQIDRLRQQGVMDNIRIITDRMYRNGRALGGDSRLEIFDDVVKSRSVKTKAERAVKIIDTLLGVSMYDSVRGRMARALNKSPLSTDVDDILTKISERKQASTGQEDWQVVSDQIAGALEKGDFTKAVDSKSVLKESLESLLRGKRIKVEYAGKASAWADAKNISIDVLEQAVRIIGTSPYFKQKNTELFLDKILNKNSTQAKVFLDSIERLSGKMSNIYFHGDELPNGQSIMEKVLGTGNSEELSAKLVELMSVPRFGNWTRDIYWYEQRLVMSVMELDAPVEQIERLMQEGVMENIAIMADRMYRNGNNLGGESRLEVFYDVIKSRSVKAKVARAIKIIDTLLGISMYNTVRGRMMRALNKAPLSADVNDILNKIVERRNGLNNGEEGWQVVSDQIATALEKGELTKAVDANSMLKDAVESLLRTKRVKAEDIGKVRDWADSENISTDVLEQIVRILGTSSYFKQKNTELLVDKLVSKTSNQAKGLLDGIERMSAKMNGIYFHGGDYLSSGQNIMERVLKEDDVEVASKKLFELMSTPGFGQWTREDYWYERQALTKLMELDEPMKQVERLMQPGVMDNIRIIADRMYRNGNALGGDLRLEFFNDVIKSASVKAKALRLVKIIDTSLPIQMYGGVRGRMVRALNRANLGVDTDNILNKISERKESARGESAWNIISEQIALTLDKDDLNGAVDGRALLRDSLVKALSSKRVGPELADKIRAWADKESTDIQILDQTIGIVSENPYMNQENTKLFLNKLVTKTPKKAKEFLDGIERLSARMSAVHFHNGDHLANGQSVIKRVLEGEESEELSTRLADLMSVKGFGNWEERDYWHERFVVLDVIGMEDPIKQIDQLMQPGVMDSIARLAGIGIRKHDSLGGWETWQNIFNDIVKSSNVKTYVERASRLIDSLLGISVSGQVRSQMVKIGLKSSSWDDENLTALTKMMVVQEAPVDEKEFANFRNMWSKAKNLEEYQLLLKVLVYLVKTRRDFTFSFAFLKTQLDAIAKVHVTDGQTRSLTPLEREIINAVNETEEKNVLLPFLLRNDFPLELREFLLKELSGFVLDGELFDVYVSAKRGRNGANTFWKTFIDVFNRFHIYSPAIMMEYILEGKITFEELERLKPKVSGLTLPKLLDVLESEGKKEDKLLLTYFIFNQPQLNYNYAFKFSLFKEVIEKALLFRQSAQTDQEAKSKLRAAIRKNSPHADEIIQAMDDGRVIIPRVSGMVDSNGDFISQPVNITFEESTALEDSREAFINQYNQHFTVLMEILYLAQTIKGILAHYDNQGYKDRLDAIVSSIRQTADINGQTLENLRQLHVDAIRLIPKYAQRTAEDARRESSAEVQRFFLRLKNQSLNQIYGFREIFQHHRLKDQNAFFKEMLWIDLDLMHKGYLKKDAYPAPYKGVDSFGSFARRTMELVRETYINQHFADVIPKERLDKILNEILGHFEAAADSFETEIKRKGQKEAQSQAEVLYLSLLAKKDLIKFMRLADGSGCCISTNRKMELSQGYSNWMGEAINDDGLQAVLIHTRNKAVGFIVWYFSEDKKGNLVIPSLRLYLRSEYHSNTISQNLWRRMGKILSPLGVKSLGISKKTDGLGQTPIPNGFKGESVSLSRFQTVKGQSDALFDLSDYGPNQFGEMYLYKADLAMLSETASGMSPLDVTDSDLEAALSAGKIIQRISGQPWQDMIKRRIIIDLNLREQTPFKRFIKDVSVTVNVVQPPQENLSTYGLAVATGKAGRDVYAASKWSQDKTKLDIFVSQYGWDYADDDVRREIVAHQLYKAFALMHSKRSSEDIDLELKIDEEIRQTQGWQDLLSEDEKSDLGLGDNVPTLHVRARAFARLMGSPSRMYAGSAYTDFLRMRREVGLKLRSIAGRFDKSAMENELEDLVLPKDGMDTLLYILNNRQTPEDFIEAKLTSHPILVWNYATYSASVFRNITHVLLDMINKNAVQKIVLRVGKENQGVIDQYLNTGVDEGNRLRDLISNKIFPAPLIDYLKTPQIWMDFFDLVYAHNLMSETPVKIVAGEEYGDLSANIFADGEKTVIVQYYDRRPSSPRGQGVYQLVHVDPEVGFADTTFNRLSYALNSTLAGREDFGLEISSEAPFHKDDIQMMSSKTWQENAIEALKAAVGSAVTSDMITGIKEQFKLAPGFDKFNLYNGVMVSIPGDDSGGEDWRQEPQPGPTEKIIADEDERELVPVGIRSTSVSRREGGINLNADKLNLEIQNGGGSIKFHFDPAMLQQLQNAPGFVPVIINIQPMTNLRMWLGLKNSSSSAIS
jgi:ribosomal protein L21E